MASSGIFSHLHNHRHYTTVFRGWVLFGVMSKQNFICQIGGMPPKRGNKREILFHNYFIMIKDREKLFYVIIYFRFDSYYNCSKSIFCWLNTWLIDVVISSLKQSRTRWVLGPVLWSHCTWQPLDGSTASSRTLTHISPESMTLMARQSQHKPLWLILWVQWILDQFNNVQYLAQRSSSIPEACGTSEAIWAQTPKICVESTSTPT